MHLKIKDGQPEPYSLSQLHRDNPSTSFPRDPSAELLAGYDVYPCARPEQPAYDWMTSRIIDGSYAKDKTGAWSQGHEIEPLPEAEAAVNIRGYRDAMLALTDWMALSDVVMPPAVSSYRQALRDVTLQSGFPYNIVWPTKP